MPAKKIKYDDNYYFLGRNGKFKMKGLDIEGFDFDEGKSYPYIELMPITSKGLLASSFLQIPKNKIQEVIDELQKYL